MWTTKNRFVTAGLVALTIAGTTIATSSQAEARTYYHHRGGGGAVIAGIAGGLLGGALIAGASHPYYGDPYYGQPYYGPAYGPRVVYEPVYHSCHIVWRQNGWGDMYRARVCN